MHHPSRPASCPHSQHPLSIAPPRDPRTRRSVSVEDYATANSDQFYDRTRPFAQLINGDDPTTALVDGAGDETDDVDPFDQRPNASAGQQLRLRLRQFMDALRVQHPSSAAVAEQDEEPTLAMSPPILPRIIVAPIPQAPASRAIAEPAAAADEEATATTAPSFTERAAALRAKWADMLAQRNIIPKDRLLPAIGRRKRRNIVPEYTSSDVDESDVPSAGYASLASRPRKHCPQCNMAEDASLLGGAAPMIPQQYPLHSAYMQLVHDVPGPLQQQQQQRYYPAKEQQQQQPQQRQQQHEQQVDTIANEPSVQQQQSSPHFQSQTAPVAGRLPRPTQPRIVYDRLGHRYIEQDGRYHLILDGQPSSVERQSPQQEDGDDDGGAVVGAAQNTDENSEYVILEDIINRNRPIIHASNIEGGHTIPEPIQLVRDTFGFLHELADSQNTQSKNYDYRVGQPQQQDQQQFVDFDPQHQQQQPPIIFPSSPAKRSFAIVPLLQDKRDGSVVVRIAPRKSIAASSSSSSSTSEVVDDNTDNDRSFAARDEPIAPIKNGRLKVKTTAAGRAIAKSASSPTKTAAGHRRQPADNAIAFDESDRAHGRYDVVIGGEGAQSMEASDADMEWMRLVYETAALENEQAPMAKGNKKGSRVEVEKRVASNAEMREMSEIMASFET